MADLTVTAASVAKVDGITTEYTAGATITAGQVVYLDSTDSDKAKLADADAVASAAAVGIALNGASSGQPVVVQKSGNINPGGTPTNGAVYCVSTTAGGIAPAADLLTADFKTSLGVSTTATNIKLGILVSGVAEP